MSIKVGDVFVCTSCSKNYPNFEIFKSYPVESIDGELVKFEGVDNKGRLLPEHDFYVFGMCEVEATFERPKSTF